MFLSRYSIVTPEGHQSSLTETLRVYRSHLRHGAVALLSLALTLALAGCNGSETSTVSHGGPVRNHVSFVDTLRAHGLTVEPTGTISQPVFPMPGQVLTVNGQNVQVFEFSDRDEAETRARAISPDGGTVNGTQVDWTAAPHIFHAGTIIVIYLGSNETILQELLSTLGPPVASTGGQRRGHVD